MVQAWVFLQAQAVIGPGTDLAAVLGSNRDINSRAESRLLRVFDHIVLFRVEPFELAENSFMPQVTPEWVTTRQLAKIMRVNAEAAAVWHRARRFPQGAVKKVGRRLFWHLPSVQAWRDPGSSETEEMA